MHSLALVQGPDGVHLVGGQLKVEDLLVGLDPRLMNGLREDDDPFLVLEAQDDLTDVLTVLLGEVVEQWLGEQVLVTLTQWCPGLQGRVGLG